MKFSNAYQGMKDNKYSGTEFCPAMAPSKTQLGKRLFQCLPFMCSVQGSKRSDNTSTAFCDKLELLQTVQRLWQ